ncbi:hypothetical protein BASA60_010016 [Batrachochytrium salamandrivorans]|nr:hypothetical protein BASA60_010016 [Batrachochytrium salamandrivorans]
MGSAAMLLQEQQQLQQHSQQQSQQHSQQHSQQQQHVPMNNLVVDPESQPSLQAPFIPPQRVQSLYYMQEFSHTDDLTVSSPAEIQVGLIPRQRVLDPARAARIAIQARRARERNRHNHSQSTFANRDSISDIPLPLYRAPSIVSSVVPLPSNVDPNDGSTGSIPSGAMAISSCTATSVSSSTLLAMAATRHDSESWATHPHHSSSVSATDASVATPLVIPASAQRASPSSSLVPIITPITPVTPITPSRRILRLDTTQAVTDPRSVLCMSISDTNLLSISICGSSRSSTLADLPPIQIRVRAAVQLYWPSGILAEWVRPQSVTFQLKKTPWVDKGPAESLLTSRLLLLGLLQTLIADGWILLAACSPVWKISDKHSMFFSRSARATEFDEASSSVSPSFLLHPRRSNSSMTSSLSSPIHMRAIGHVPSGLLSSSSNPSFAPRTAASLSPSRPPAPTPSTPSQGSTLKHTPTTLLSIIVSRLPWTDSAPTAICPPVEQGSHQPLAALDPQPAKSDMFILTLRAPYRIQIIGLIDPTVIPSIRKHIQMVWTDGIATESHDAHQSVYEFVLKTSRDSNTPRTMTYSPLRTAFSLAESVIGHRLLARLVVVLKELHRYALYTTIRMAEQTGIPMSNPAGVASFPMHLEASLSPNLAEFIPRDRCSNTCLVFMRLSTRSKSVESPGGVPHGVISSTTTTMTTTTTTTTTETRRALNVNEISFDDTDEEGSQDENEIAENENPTETTIMMPYRAPRASIARGICASRSFGIYIHGGNSIRTTTLRQRDVSCLHRHLSSMMPVVKHGRIWVTRSANTVGLETPSQSIHFFRVKGSPFSPVTISGPAALAAAESRRCDLMRVRVLVHVLDGMYRDRGLRLIGSCDLINDTKGDLPMMIVEQSCGLEEVAETESTLDPRPQNEVVAVSKPVLAFAVALMQPDGVELVFPAGINDLLPSSLGHGDGGDGGGSDGSTTRGFSALASPLESPRHAFTVCHTPDAMEDRLDLGDPGATPCMGREDALNTSNSDPGSSVSIESHPSRALACRAVSAVQHVLSQWLAEPSTLPTETRYEMAPSTSSEDRHPLSFSSHVVWQLSGAPWVSSNFISERDDIEHTFRVRDWTGQLIAGLCDAGFRVGATATISTKLPGNDTLFFVSAS